MKVLKPRSSQGGIEFGGRERMPNLGRSNKDELLKEDGRYPER